MIYIVSGLYFVIIAMTALMLSLHSRLSKLELQFLKERNRVYRHLTDPNVIDSELERSARRREAYDSNMPYPPREDSGPPARILKPKLPAYGSKFADRKPRYQPGPVVRNQPKKDG